MQTLVDSYTQSILDTVRDVKSDLVQKFLKDYIILVKNGKNIILGLDGLTVEHLTHSHPILLSILAKLFNICLSAGYVPNLFGLLYSPFIEGVDNGF